VITGPDGANKPYSMRLSAGESQLQPVFFRLEVLEPYRRDPRYNLVFGGYSGHFFCSEGMPEREEASLQTFGIARRPNRLRAVVVWLWYLSELSSWQQSYWYGFELDEECKILGAYWQQSVEGAFPTDGSTYKAVLEEQRMINEICRSIGRPELFRQQWDTRTRPPEFSVFMTPTRASFSRFVALLDKMLGDNLNGKFFGDDVPRTDSQGKDLRPLRRLEAWLSLPLGPEFPKLEDISVVIDPLMEVRDLRNPEAHAIRDDAYDPAYYEQQEKLMERIYSSLRTLRILLSKHPYAEPVAVPDWIENWRISHY
jgi:hypothetical protein